MNEKTNLLKIKFTLDRSETGWNSATDDRRRSDKHDLDDRESISDQGGAVVPDVKTLHEVERPETHD